MRIRYHYFHKIRAWNRKWEAHHFGISKQTLWSQRNASHILFIDPYSNQHTNFFDTIENSLMDLSRESQTLTNTSEFEELRDKWRKVQIIAECSRSRKLDFPNKYDNDLLSNVFYLSNFSCYFSQCRWSLPPKLKLTRFPPLFFLFFWILFITKYYKI